MKLNSGSAAPRIGITGTNGKTSTILILKFILEGCGLHPAVLDMWKGSMSYARLAGQAQQADCVAAEVPVEAIRQAQLSGSDFDVAALTNLSPDHLRLCRTPENYYSVKSRPFYQLPAQAKAIINADDPLCLALAQDGRLDFLTYAIDYPNAMLVAHNIRRDKYRQKFDIKVNTEFSGLERRVVVPASVSVILPLPGRHNIYNTLLACAIALLLGLDLTKIAEILNKIPGISRNMEVISFDNYQIIDDAAKNPAALQAALAAAVLLAEGPLHILHGLYGGGGQTLNQCNARVLSAHLSSRPLDTLFITRGMYHTSSKYQVRLSEEKAFLEELRNSNNEFFYFPDLPDALESILSRAKPEDLVLLAGGPVLNKAGSLLQRAGGKKASALLVPAAMAGTPRPAHPQAICGNPT